MADSVAFDLVSPEKLLYSESVDMVVIPGADGNFGVLPRHAPLISNVRAGVIEIYKDGQVTDRIFVAGGFAEVTSDRCTVLADVAMPLSEIDGVAADEQLRNAQDGLADAKTEAERAAASKAIAVAEAAGAAENAGGELRAAQQFLDSAEEKLQRRAYSEARDDALQAKDRALKALATSENVNKDHDR